MITNKEIAILSATKRGREELNLLQLQRQDEMNRILPGFYTVCLGKKIYSPRASQIVNN